MLLNLLIPGLRMGGGGGSAPTGPTENISDRIDFGYNQDNITDYGYAQNTKIDYGQSREEQITY